MATDINRDVARLMLTFKTKLNSESKLYVVNKDVLGTYGKYYDYQSMDLRQLRFAQDAMGSYSDCFILYAVAMMKAADVRAIRQFLLSLKARQPELDICADNEDGLVNRVKSLRSNGFLFQHRYMIESLMPGSDRVQENAVVLYSIDKDSQMFMNQKLSTKISADTWFCAKPLHELIGWAASNYIGAMISKNKAFVSFKEPVFRTKNVGVVFFPMELAMMIEQTEVRVAIMPSFLYQDKRSQDDESFAKTKVRIINTILNYLYVNESKGRVARVVVAVNDTADVENMRELIIQTEVLLSHIEKIYFTGEGVINSAIGYNSMLRLENTKSGYVFNIVTPDFIA